MSEGSIAACLAAQPSLGAGIRNHGSGARSYGYQDKVLTATAVVDIKTGQMVPLTGLPAAILTSQVAGPTALWVAVATTPEPERWAVAEDGTAK